MRTDYIANKVKFILKILHNIEIANSAKKFSDLCRPLFLGDEVNYGSKLPFFNYIFEQSYNGVIEEYFIPGYYMNFAAIGDLERSGYYFVDIGGCNYFAIEVDRSFDKSNRYLFYKASNTRYSLQELL